MAERQSSPDAVERQRNSGQVERLVQVNRYAAGN